MARETSGIRKRSDMEWRQDNYLASDDKALLCISEIVALLNELYQTKDCSPEKVKKLIENSFCLGLYSNNRLIGFVRIITDKINSSLMKDFIIEEAHRRKDLGSFLMNCVLVHPDLSQTEMILGTRDASGFFQKFGFEWDNFMLRDVPQQHQNRLATKTQPKRILGDF